MFFTAFFIISHGGQIGNKKAGEHSSPLRCVLFLFVGAICDRPLGGCIQHIFNKNAVAGSGIVDKDMRHRTHQLAVLDDGTSGHADVKCGTKEFCTLLRFLCVFAGKRQVFTYPNRDP